MIGRPSLLILTAAAAALSTVAHGVNATGGGQEQPTTRLGASIGADMATRDQAARRRDRALELREQALKATEARLKADLAGQQQAKSASASGAAAAGETPSQYEDLARIFQAMKPAKAAVVFEQLDMDVQMKVAQGMRERSTAMIFASMTPKGAAALSMALARKYPVAAGRAPRAAKNGAR